MSGWTPPPDPDRPNCPYFPGFTVDITPHAPPRPFGTRDYEPWPGRSAPSPRSNVTQSGFVLACPPLENNESTIPPSSAANFAKAQITVKRTITIGNSRPGQIVECEVKPIEPGKPPFTAVAKIFDALYYPFIHEYGGRADVSRMADQHYSCEAAAYEQLHKAGLTGGFAPEYYGSWTFTLPLTQKGETHQRRVRLVLIEALKGSSVFDLFARNSPCPDDHKDGFHFPEEYRLDVLAQVTEGETRLAYAGVNQQDTAPRNVILVDPTTKDSQVSPYGDRPRVVLVDYNRAIVWKWTKQGTNPFEELPTMPNPLIRYWNSAYDEWTGWAPEDFTFGSNNRRRWEWLWSLYGGDNATRFAPIDEVWMKEYNNFSLEERKYEETDPEDLEGSNDGQP